MTTSMKCCWETCIFTQGQKIFVCFNFVSPVCIWDFYLMAGPKIFPEYAKFHWYLKLACIFHVFALIFFSVSPFWKHSYNSYYNLYSPILLHPLRSIYIHSGFQASTASRKFIINKSTTTYWPHQRPVDSKWLDRLKWKIISTLFFFYIWCSAFLFHHLHNNAINIFYMTSVSGKTLN